MLTDPGFTYTGRRYTGGSAATSESMANQQAAEAANLAQAQYAQALASGPMNGGFAYGSSGLSNAGQQYVNNLVSQINASDNTGRINAAYDASRQNALNELHLQQESALAQHGYAPGDPAGRNLGARLYGQAMAPIEAARANALVGADRDKLQMLAGLVPAFQQQDRLAFEQQQAAQQALEHQAEFAYQQKLRDYNLRRLQQDSQQQRGPMQGSVYTPPMSDTVRPTPATAYQVATGAPRAAAPAIPVAGAPLQGGVSAVWNAPGAGGNYDFMRGFGTSYYGPLGPGGAENAIDAQNRRAEIAAAGNGPMQGNFSTNTSQRQYSGTTTPNGATGAPVPGAVLVSAPPMSGISVAGPMTSDPMARGATPYGTWSGTGSRAYGDSTLASYSDQHYSPYAYATGRA